MGFDGFGYEGPAEIFAEHVGLSEVQNNGTRLLNLEDWKGQDFETLLPTQWGGRRPFADGIFQTHDGRARFVPTAFNPVTIDEGKYTLNTGRIRDQWHTMTRTGLVPKLFGHRAEPYIEISPATATSLGFQPADLAEISGEHGKSVARVLITETVREGDVFQPMHWTSQFASQALANSNTSPAVDPFSGQPALKSSAVSIAKKVVAWHGCGVALGPLDLRTCYWAKAPLSKGLAFECADEKLPADWLSFCESLMSMEASEISTVLTGDQASFRCVARKNGNLIFAFFASAQPVEVSRAWLHQQLGSDVQSVQVLSGRPAAAVLDHGPIICSCNGVGRNIIKRAAYDIHGATLSAICEKTNAGMGCGSCRPEVQRIITEISATRIAAE